MEVGVCTGRTQAMQIQMPGSGPSPWQGWLPQCPGFYPVVLRCLCISRKKVWPQHWFCTFKRHLVCPQSIHRKVAYTLPSHIVKVKMEVQWEVGIEDLQCILTKWLTVASTGQGIILTKLRAHVMGNKELSSKIGVIVLSDEGQLSGWFWWLQWQKSLEGVRGCSKVLLGEFDPTTGEAVKTVHRTGEYTPKSYLKLDVW